ncbi:MAG: PAS domain S-box-containing protein [Verrucomicrobiales bacterium]
MSLFVSARLSKPVEQLAEESAENRVQRDLAEAAQLESEQKYRSIFENAVEGVFVLSAEGCVISANPALARICGYPSPPAMTDKPSSCQFANLYADLERCYELVNTVNDQGSVSGFEAEMVALDGRRIWVSQNMRRVDAADGESYHFEGSMEDITARKHADDEMRSLNGKLKTAMKDLKSTQQQIIQQERLRALGEMATGVAHDFNNALTPILGYSELLLVPWEEMEESLRESYLEMITTAATDAASVVTRLREFFRPNLEDDAIGPVDLNELVTQTINLTQPRWRQQAQSKGITIEVTTDLAGHMPSIAGEAPALRDMLTNLIFNAVDAMPDGGRIVVRTSFRTDRNFIEVSDSGIGMSEDVRKHCLEPFFSTKGEHGTGLGLSMVFGIVKRHSGTIDIRSKTGEGSTFVISLPPVVQAGATEMSDDQGGDGAKFQRPLQILVVDDEKPIRVFLAAVLKKDGHQAVLAENGAEALELFGDGQGFDLMMTDKAMPNMNGDQLATAIKQRSPETPVILLTGFGRFLDISTFPDIDVLASKPISIDALRDAIASATTPPPPARLAA